VPVVVRKSLFNDPNSVLNDFMELAQDNRASIMDAFTRSSSSKVSVPRRTGSQRSRARSSSEVHEAAEKRELGA
jgi:hypothetical protein